MSLDAEIRDRVVLSGGKVVGVDCPDCPFESHDVDVTPFASTDVACPDCGATILTEDDKLQLVRANKL